MRTTSSILTSGKIYPLVLMEFYRTKVKKKTNLKHFSKITTKEAQLALEAVRSPTTHFSIVGREQHVEFPVPKLGRQLLRVAEV